MEVDSRVLGLMGLVQGANPETWGVCVAPGRLGTRHALTGPLDSRDGLQDTETPFCQKTENGSILEHEGSGRRPGPIPQSTNYKTQSLQSCHSPR